MSLRTKQDVAERIYKLLQDEEFIKFYDNDFFIHIEKDPGAKSKEEIVAQIKKLL